MTVCALTGDSVTVKAAGVVPLWPSVTLTLLTLNAGTACTLIVLLVAAATLIRSFAKMRTL